MVCNHCGTRLADGAATCTGCGGQAGGNAPTSAPSGGAPAAWSGVIVSGYILACLLPPLGFVAGLLLIVKGSKGHGVNVLILSLGALFVWLKFLFR